MNKNKSLEEYLLYWDKEKVQMLVKHMRCEFNLVLLKKAYCGPY